MSMASQTLLRCTLEVYGQVLGPDREALDLYDLDSEQKLVWVHGKGRRERPCPIGPLARDRRGWSGGPARIPCGTASPPTCWTSVPSCAASRNC
jgi:hypothetical protein